MVKPDEFEDPATIETAIIERSGLFDAPWYLARYADVAASGMDPLTHFIRFGGAEGRRPSFYFDPVWYLDTYRWDGGFGGNPLLHYIVHGERDGARPSPHFDPTWYRQAFALDPDTSPLSHFLARRTRGLGSPRSRRQDIAQRSTGGRRAGGRPAGVLDCAAANLCGDRVPARCGARRRATGEAFLGTRDGSDPALRRVHAGR